MQSKLVTCKINTQKVPRSKYFKGKKGVYLDFTIAERKDPDQFGNTHSIYLYDKESKEKTYIGEGKELKFEAPPVEDADLPPGATDVEDAEIIDDNKKTPF